MTSLSLSSFNFNVDYFISEQFLSNCQNSTSRFNEEKFDNYLFSSVKRDCWKIESNFKNDYKVTFTIKRAKELITHLEEIATECKAFNRNRFNKPEKYIEFVTNKLKLSDQCKAVSGEYIYFCLTLLHIFPNRVEMLKSELEDLLAYYENKLTINESGESQGQFISTISSQKQIEISYQILVPEESVSEKKTFIKNETPIDFDNQQNKRGKIIWKDADLLFAIYFVLLDLKIIVMPD
jgi:hypothetical protein